MKKKRKFSMRLRIVVIGLSCWLIPFVMMTGMLGYYIFSDQRGERAQRQMEQLRYNGGICGERLNTAIAASRAASYEGELKKQWKEIAKDSKTRSDNYGVLNRCSSYLARKYQRDMNFEETFFWFQDQPEKLNAAVYNGRAGGSYRQVEKFWAEDFPAVQEYAKTLDTSTGFFMLERRVYMVRNLMDGYFHTVGTLVMRLNVDYIFGSLLYLTGEGQVDILLDDLVIDLEGKEHFLSREEFQGIKEGYEWNRDFLQMKTEREEESYFLKICARIPRKAVDEPVEWYLYGLVGMIVLLFPLMGILFWVLKKHISVPVEKLMEGADQVEQGNLGYQVAYEPDSQEFLYLVSSFNQMSEHLKYQFDHIYQEELALRDARIMALQSHINPHFLNNTMEIINWQARMEGNDKVSKMIEALSVLMNAAMDRKKLPEVSLREEMRYVDAYLYITRERLGNRLEIIRELPEELMDEKVPRLILQPVIENAIVHGILPLGRGTVWIQGRKEENYIYLEICNRGELTEEEKRKVSRLLDPEYNTSKESSGNLGIANVNQRLRILYGEPCGLEIFEQEEDLVCARLTIRGNGNCAG